MCYMILSRSNPSDGRISRTFERNWWSNPLSVFPSLATFWFFNSSKWEIKVKLSQLNVERGSKKLGGRKCYKILRLQGASSYREGFDKATQYGLMESPHYITFRRCFYNWAFNVPVLFEPKVSIGFVDAGKGCRLPLCHHPCDVTKEKSPIFRAKFGDFSAEISETFCKTVRKFKYIPENSLIQERYFEAIFLWTETKFFV